MCATRDTPAKSHSSSATPCLIDGTTLVKTKWIRREWDLKQQDREALLPNEWIEGSANVEEAVAQVMARKFGAALGKNKTTTKADDVMVWVDQHLPVFSARLFLCHLDSSRGDGTISIGGVPVLLWEVISGKKTLENACAHLAVLVISQLVVLREAIKNDDDAPKACSGLLFPSKTTRIPLMKLTAEWDTNDCKFLTTVEQCNWDQRDAVFDQLIEQGIEFGKRVSKQNPKIHHLLRLLPSEIGAIKTKLKIDSSSQLKQESSLAALVFSEVDEGGNTVAFWKTSNDLGDAVHKAKGLARHHPEIESALVLPVDDMSADRVFFKFPAHAGLEQSDLQNKDTVKLVADCLETLHNTGFAHVDLRWPNLVWSDRDRSAVKLIDLDRLCRITVRDFAYYKSGWYPEGFTAEQLDWYQLGASVLLSHFDQLNIEQVRDVDYSDCSEVFYPLIKQGQKPQDFSRFAVELEVLKLRMPTQTQPEASNEPTGRTLAEFLTQFTADSEC